MTRLHAIAERLHHRVHQGTCTDMHPSVHQDHLQGFLKRAQLILDAEVSK